MRLQGRELRAGMAGDDVKELHIALGRLDYRLPEQEVRHGIFGTSTAQAVAVFQKAQGLLDTAVVDARTAEALDRATEDAEPAVAPPLPRTPIDADPPAPDEPAPVEPSGDEPLAAEPEYLVRGQIIYRGGLPIPNLVVRAIHRDLRREVDLGQATTDARGLFEIHYGLAGLGLPPGRSADLLVRAFQRTDDGTAALVAESKVIYHARKVEKVRLQVDGGPENTWSEYEQLLAEVKPLLGDVAIDSLHETDDDPDVSLLVGKTGQPARRVADLVLAHKLAAHSKVSPELYYGLIRSGLGTNLSEMLAQPAEVQRRALESAVESRIVPGRLADEVDEVPRRLAEAAQQWMLRLRVDDGRTPFGAVLATALPAAPDRTAFAARFLAHRGPVEDFWAGVRDDDRLGPRAESVQLSLRLAALTRSHVPTMQALRERVGRAGFRGLAGLSTEDFEQIIGALPEEQRFPPGIPGGSPQERLTAYAQTLSRIVSDALPTEVLAHRAADDTEQPADARTFWRNVIASDVGFDLRKTNVGTFLSAHPELLSGVADEAGVRAEVAGVRRLFNLTRDYDQVRTLQQAGLDSATAVTRLGTGVFVSRFGDTFGGGAAALVAYEKAATVSGTSLALASSLSPLFQNLGTYALSTPDLSALPDLRTLFGSLDYCDCAHCRSVLSPAAYLTELLTWLGERALADDTTARDVLYARRPDIGEIELTCANTNTSLPYVDLAIELLELLVEPLEGFAVPGSLAGDLDARTISAAVRDAFAANGVPLAGEHVAYVVEPDQHWFLTDHATLYVVRRSAADELEVRLGSYQTRGTDVELAAEAEHQHAPAYQRLRDAIHPSALPLDLWWEEVRAYLDHLGVARTDLMREFAPAASDVDADLAFATEQLALTPVERDLVTGTGAAGTRPPWEHFGLAETGNLVEVFDASAPGGVSTQPLGWLAALSWVRELLKRTELTYQELLDALDTRFVNPDGAVRIESADPADLASCDLAKLRLTNLTVTAASRLRRYVRLRRRLGWRADELDDAIAALASDTPDVDEQLSDTLVLRLSHLVRLRATVGGSIEELCAFWAPLGTRRDDALYHRLFRNPAVLLPLDPAFRLNAQRDELAIVTESPADATIGAHTPTVLAALGLTAAELDLLAGVLPDDTLDLANLGTLHRHARLARGLGLSIRDLLTLREAAGLDPFADTADTVRFVDLASRIRASGLSVSEVDYLLFHQTPLAPAEAELATILTEVRDGLRSIADETAGQPGPAGERLAKALASLRWPIELVERLVALLDGSATYSAALAAAPGDLTVPPGLADRVTYTDGRLLVRGTLTTAERDALLAGSADGDYHAAVAQIFDAPRGYATTYLTAFAWPAFRAPLPAPVAVPADLRERVYHDGPAGQLVSVGPLTETDRNRLLALSADTAFQAAVTRLFEAPATFVPDPGNAFLEEADVSAILDLPQAERFAAVNAPLREYLRLAASRRLVVHHLGEALGVPTRIAERLLTRQVSVAGEPGRPAVEAFLDAAFADSHPDVALSEASFPAPFRTFLRLHKAAALIGGLRLTTTELDWLAAYGDAVPPRSVPWLPGTGATARWLRFDDIPATATARTPGPLAALLRLVELGRIRAGLGEATVGDVLAAAHGPSPASLLALFADRTGSDEAELTTLAGPGILDLDLPDAFRDETGPALIARCLRRMRAIGSSANQCRAFAAPSPDAVDARAARHAAKARYGEADWPAVARPLRDRLRSRQRDALVAYLVTRGHDFADVNSLYRHLLMDCEMDPCMVTSRIKQAIGSVQLFVQRCLLNLEPDVVVDEAVDTGWRDWRWMKSYRVWEANRKVFCYPENWLEPELRDDKTPFFEELESALLQDDVTAEVAEEAFRTYLQRLDGVARLEILGSCREAAADGRPAVLHVFGRTQGMAPTYYHRQRIDGGRWTAWQRIDVDITEPQLLPVVWNRRLYLFWPVFTEGTIPVEPPPDKPVTPKRYFDIQLAWSEFRQGRWQPKQLSSLTVRSAQTPDASPDHGRHAHVLRARVTDPALRVWYEYNNPSTTYDESDDYYGPVTYGFATVNGWYFTGCDAKVQGYSQRIYGLFEPNATVPSGMLFEQVGANPLYLPTGGSAAQEDVALAAPPATFTLSYTHEDAYITGGQTFFFQDAAKTYHVDPSEEVVWDQVWSSPWAFGPLHVDLVNQRYYEPDLATVDGAGPIEPTPMLRALLHGRGAAPSAATRGAADDPVTTALATIDGGRAALVRAQTAELEARARPGATVDAPSTQALRNVIVSRPDKALLTIGEYVDEARALGAGWTVPVAATVHRYHFKTHYHPYACAFLRDLNAGGIERLVRRTAQLRSANPFAGRYQPTDLVLAGPEQQRYPIEDVDFDHRAAYAAYNWELFFHAPLLVALRLSANQRFEEAQRWFHLVFDPTDASNGPVPARFWQTRPFYEQSQPELLAQRIEELLAQLADGSADPALVKQVREWRAQPFQPFAIARLRITAFQRSVVMRYLDNLVAWGDQLFRRDTIESINEATQLYVLAAELLGPRPAGLAPRAAPQVRTAVSLDPELDALSNTLVELEQLIASPAPDSVIVPPDAPPLTLAKMAYFGVPRNDKLLGYWDTVADRLFKIRHCMNIEGVVRQLPLFEPPIDPALLVRATAAGVDIASALADVSAPVPHYRFRTLVQRAGALCQEVKSLGQQLLGALERRDAEALARLRATQERELTDLVEQVRVRQQDEARAQIAALRAARAVAVGRYLHFQRLLGTSAPRTPAEDEPIPLVDPSANAGIAVSEGVRMLRHDRAELSSLSDAHDNTRLSSGSQVGASVFSVLPTVSFDAKPWGVGTGSSWGGPNLGAAASALAGLFGIFAESDSHDAGRSARLAQHVVREHDWVLQSNQAALDIMSIDRQRLAAELRLEIAGAELANHRTQMEHQRAAEEFLRNKFTNRELYEWMVGRLSTVYFQSYQLAYDAAKAAERAFRRDLGVAESEHIRFGYWDSLRKGLLAGEQLQHALGRMEAAYLDQHRREYELTKHVSLAGLHPEALVDLRETGRCYVQIPEAVFDLDRPGDHLRRIRAVSLSIPCTVGPYASVNCSLTLLSSRVRVETGTVPEYAWTGPDDTRFRHSAGGTTTIVTSSGREDAGLFETSLSDERYLPFEGDGAISTWLLELPTPLRQFDYQSITDVVIHLRYTARGGGPALRAAALDELTAQLNAMEVEQGVRGMFRLLSARHEFGNAWQAFLYAPPDPAAPQRFAAVLGIDRFPSMVRDQAVRIAQVAVFFRPAAAYDDSQPFAVLVHPPGGGAPHPVPLQRVDTHLGGLPGGVLDLGPGGVPLDAEAPWTIEVTDVPDDLAEEVEVDGQTVRRLRPGAVTDLGLLVRYVF
ncbi:hypothetical protein Ais01nite_20230 [Asanoa ishikariensis]|uniref:Putative peptidoglycan binding domain-containing protein n=1 Tax=Asanoa ishikariensis TaxID=137265 RepID=A0A1H3UA16_9ACTN|nr:neuraminidase-like domain-containing protein [Asanoa ishikariensis]GIF63988.1 hypothetical protein Ais01nite_20230 [Asanoa ishikariensis]SDZ59310.1 Putative peptidoglycan binding domain-containing protein [Asanoa ishikariensis]